MANPNINFFNRTKLKFASKLFPFKSPRVSKLDYLDCSTSALIEQIKKTLDEEKQSSEEGQQS